MTAQDSHVLHIPEEESVTDFRLGSQGVLVSFSERPYERHEYRETIPSNRPLILSPDQTKRQASDLYTYTEMPHLQTEEEEPVMFSNSGVIKTKKQPDGSPIVLGKHYHEYTTEGFVIADGNPELTYGFVDQSNTLGETITVPLKTGSIIVFPPRVAHTFAGVERYTLIPMSTGPIPNDINPL